VLAVLGAFAGTVGLVAWLVAGFVVVDAPAAGTVAGAAFVSLGMTALPLFSVRQADSTFGEMEDPR
jgi:hypothetical protein